MYKPIRTCPWGWGCYPRHRVVIQGSGHTSIDTKPKIPIPDRQTAGQPSRPKAHTIGVLAVLLNAYLEEGFRLLRYYLSVYLSLSIIVVGEK